MPPPPAVRPEVPPIPVEPDECAATGAHVVAQDGSPELLAWWLECPGRTIEDAEALVMHLLELGRVDTAEAIVASLEEGA